MPLRMDSESGFWVLQPIVDHKCVSVHLIIIIFNNILCHVGQYLNNCFIFPLNEVIRGEKYFIVY